MTPHFPPPEFLGSKKTVLFEAMERPASAEEPKGKKPKAETSLPGDGTEAAQQALLALPAPELSESGSNALPENGNGSSPASGAANSLPANGKGGTSQVAVKQEPLDAPKAKATAKAMALPAIPPKEASNMMKHMKRLEKKGDNQLLQCASCKTQQDKRAFFYTVCQLDPRVSKKDVLKEDRDEESHKVEINDDWFTADQIAADKGVLPDNPNYVNLLHACTAGLQERPHESPALAKMGVMQYKEVRNGEEDHYPPPGQSLEIGREGGRCGDREFRGNEVSIGRACPQENDSKKEEKESERARDAEG